MQQAVFRAQLRLARELDRPVVIHTREADDDTLAILREEGGGRAARRAALLHRRRRRWPTRGLDLGFYISLAGIVTFPKAAELRETARRVPLDRLLTETDSPFLAPVPYRGKRNEPAYVARVVDGAGRAARDRRPRDLAAQHDRELPHAVPAVIKFLAEPPWKNRRSPCRRSSSRSAPTSSRSIASSAATSSRRSS